MLQRLQSRHSSRAISATHLITGTRRCEHITPVLQKLHWFPVRQRVEFKLACLVHQSLAEQTPPYLASSIQLTANTGRRPQLRSASERICVVPRTHNSFSDRSFSAARWSSCVECLAIISAAGHELQPLQACTVRTYV